MKVAICVPTSGSIKSAFLVSLMKLVFGYEDIMWNLIIKEGSNIPNNRLQAVKEALASDPDYILFIDDDMAFAPEVFGLLARWDLPVVIGNYPLRTYPLQFSSVTETTEDKKELEAVLYGGFGMALIKADVFKQIPKPWFLPRYNEEADEIGTEDSPFYYECYTREIPVYVDHDVSKLLRHVGTHAFSWQSPQKQ